MIKQTNIFLLEMRLGKNLETNTITVTGGRVLI